MPAVSLVATSQRQIEITQDDAGSMGISLLAKRRDRVDTSSFHGASVALRQSNNLGADLVRCRVGVGGMQDKGKDRQPRVVHHTAPFLSLCQVSHTA